MKEKAYRYVGPKGRNSLAQANGLGLQTFSAPCGLKGRVNARPLSRTFSAGIPCLTAYPARWAGLIDELEP